ncbi:hypothetical protein CROQUDRAFT_89186 [Cronartium quercuum f. sp. fusiforme G11]|uniref:Uncharacterized protein n=1 Tax=Cronartium quercuum f. sp. fusiforme G11 TaxID=708437 RepID=A0A9P6NS81_9BASI|nr:hypothetical protein CROQUDRAFT_89186 [Cronartium quercuum f. sp. fusiforme G11]
MTQNILAHSNDEDIPELPKVPIISTFTKALNDFPINFYDPTWFNNLQPSQKCLVANENQVAFLPDASKLLLPVCHPDEKLGNRAFTAKYLNILREPYEIITAEDKVALQEDEQSSESLGSCDLNEMDNFEEDESSDSDFYSEGETGDLYEDKKEEVVVGKGKGKAKAVDKGQEAMESEDEMDDE